MNEQDAIEMGIKLRLAFPKMNDEQNRMLTKAFEAYDVPDVSEAIEVHYRRFSDFPNGKALMDQIDLNARTHSKTAVDRLNSEVRQAEDRAMNRKAEQDRIEIDERRQDAFIADLSDEDLQTLKELAVKNWDTDDNTKKFMMGKNARTSRLLKGMIYAVAVAKQVPA